MEKHHIHCHEDIFGVQLIVVTSDGWSDDYVHWMKNLLAGHWLQMDRQRVYRCIHPA